MLMRVVPQVRRLCSFMLAVRRCCGPNGLQRKPHQQKNDQKTAHVVMLNDFVVRLF